MGKVCEYESFKKIVRKNRLVGVTFYKASNRKVFIYNNICS